MPASVTQAQLILNTARGIAMPAWTPRLALFLGDPLLGGSEVAGGSYVRVNVIFGAPDAGARIILNTNLVSFPAPTANWGILTHGALMDAMTGGNVREVFELVGSEEQRTILVGSAPPSFGPGTISWMVP